MNQDFLAALHKATPLCDKILAVVGGAVAGTLTLGHLQAGIGILVGVLTGLTLIPRLVIGWVEMKERLRAAEKVNEDKSPDE